VGGGGTAASDPVAAGGTAASDAVGGRGAAASDGWGAGAGAGWLCSRNEKTAAIVNASVRSSRRIDQFSM
jgi:hypothetical protein